MKKAVIYARVSTDEQSRGYSLKTQIDAMTKYCRENGFSVVGEYKDDYTGTKLDRPELDKLRQHLKREKIDAVIVYDIDRLARKSVYQMLIEEEFERAGARVIYVNGQYEDTDEGRLQKQIKSSIAEYERAKILERSKRGKRGKAQSGFVLVGARSPYGYQVKSEPHKEWLEMCEEEAQIVRLVFTWYIYGEGKTAPRSIRGIGTRLREMQIPTRGDKMKHVAKKRGFAIWTDAMIRHILTNEAYTGVWHFGKTHVVSDGKEQSRKAISKRGLGKQVARPRADWIPVQVPAIIDRVTFDQAQKRLVLNREQSKRNTKREYLLGKRMRCAHCNYTMVGFTRRERNQYYMCNGHRAKINNCTMPAFRVDRVDAAIWEWVKDSMQHPEKVTAGLRGTQAETERDNAALTERLKVIEARLAETIAKREKLLDLFLDTDFPKELLTERKMNFDKTIEDLEQEREELAAHLNTTVITDEQVTLIETFCAEVREGLEGATFEDKRRYFDLLDVRAKLAVENNEKVAYITCKIGKSRLSVVATSPLSNTGAISTRACACPSTIPSP